VFGTTYSFDVGCKGYAYWRVFANHESGGVQWAAGNYSGGGWETGAEVTMEKLASFHLE